MKKHFGLTNTEETVLDYSSTAETVIDVLGLIALNSVVIGAAIANWNDFSYDKVVDFAKNNRYSQIPVWIFAVGLATKTLAYFVRTYLASKLVLDYTSTEGIERR